LKVKKRKNFVFAVLGTCFLIVKGFMFIVAAGGDYLSVLLAIMILALAILSLIFVSISYKEFYQCRLVAACHWKNIVILVF
jgi:hypothetical protein